MHVYKFIYVYLYERRCKCWKKKYIEREIKVTFILFGTRENLGKNLVESSKVVANL